ncbi:MAG: VanZ family protein [Myxococcota bacterium]
MARSSAAVAARAWVALLGYVGLIYASLPVSRDVLIALNQRELMGWVLTASYFGAAVVVVYHVVFDVRLTDRVAFVALVILGSVIGALVLGMSIPEERMHFLQYGLMALLARYALSFWVRPGAQYGLAVVLAGLAGWGDELVQGVLPDRVYDPFDVLVNVVAAVLALAGYEALHNRLGWRPRSRPPSGPSDPAP